MSNEQRYYDALKRITAYMSPTKLQRTSEKKYGLPFDEALEMAYENVLAEAALAIRGKRRPSLAAPGGVPKHAGADEQTISLPRGQEGGV